MLWNTPYFQPAVVAETTELRPAVKVSEASLRAPSVTRRVFGPSRAVSRQFTAEASLAPGQVQEPPRPHRYELWGLALARPLRRCGVSRRQFQPRRNFTEREF
ncbi:MAG: hypothetical protein O3A00_13760 [Planctomycetota bacterium]|nr:hypothetical protein [Planctomycetota bacterium]